MTDVWGALSQTAPLATTLTASYTVPAGKHATVEVVICNRGASATVRLAHSVDGATIANAQYILYDFPLAAGETKTTARFTVGSTDIIRVYASTADVSFNVNGIEEDD